MDMVVSAANDNTNPTPASTANTNVTPAPAVVVNPSVESDPVESTNTNGSPGADSIDAASGSSELDAKTNSNSNDNALAVVVDANGNSDPVECTNTNSNPVAANVSPKPDAKTNGNSNDNAVPASATKTAAGSASLNNAMDEEAPNPMPSSGSESQGSDYRLQTPRPPAGKSSGAAERSSGNSGSSLFGVDDSDVANQNPPPLLTPPVFRTYTNDAVSRKRLEDTIRKFSEDTLPPTPKNASSPLPKKARTVADVNATVLHDDVQQNHNATILREPVDNTASPHQQNVNDTVLHAGSVFTPEKTDDASTKPSAARKKPGSGKFLAEFDEWKKGGRKNRVAEVRSERGSKFDPDAVLRLPNTKLRSPGVFNANGRETSGLFSSSSSSSSARGGASGGNSSYSGMSGNSSGKNSGNRGGNRGEGRGGA
jgi:hypothetical protein